MHPAPITACKFQHAGPAKNIACKGDPQHDQNKPK